MRIKIDNLKLTIGQGTLKQTSQCKYLVLIIDNKLNWAAHIAHVKSKLSKCVGILVKARPCLSRKCLLDLYYSFAYPYLMYCVELWGHTGDRLIHPLFLVQKKNNENYIFFCLLGPYCSNFSETEIIIFM